MIFKCTFLDPSVDIDSSNTALSVSIHALLICIILCKSLCWVQVHRSIAPKYLQELFTKNSEHSSRQAQVTTRGQDNLHLPRPLLRKSFSFQGALKYNGLPQEQKQYQHSRTVYTNCSPTVTKPLFFYFLVFCSCLYSIQDRPALKPTLACISFQILCGRICGNFPIKAANH